MPRCNRTDGGADMFARAAAAHGTRPRFAEEAREWYNDALTC